MQRSLLSAVFRPSWRTAGKLTASALAAGVALASVGAVSAAQADTTTLKYTCSASILTNQPFTAIFRGAAPADAAVGDTVSLTGLGAEVVVNPEATNALYGILGVRSVTGTAQVELGVDNAGTPAPLPATPMTIPATPVPATGSLAVNATGTGPSFTTTTAGKVSFVAGPFTAALVGTTEAGGTTNVPVTCTLDPGQDPTIATVSVT